MAIHVMLTVDLNRRITEEARNRFNEYLKQQHWTKLSLTTTWYARFTDGVIESSALNETKKDVVNAAAHAGVSSYEAAAEAGTSAPTIWNPSV